MKKHRKFSCLRSLTKDPLPYLSVWETLVPKLTENRANAHSCIHNVLGKNRKRCSFPQEHVLSPAICGLLSALSGFILRLSRAQHDVLQNSQTHFLKVLPSFGNLLSSPSLSLPLCFFLFVPSLPSFPLSPFIHS